MNMNGDDKQSKNNDSSCDSADGIGRVYSHKSICNNKQNNQNESININNF